MRLTKNILLFVSSMLLTTVLFSSCFPDEDGIVELNSDQRAQWVEKASGEYFAYLELKKNGEKDYIRERANFEISKTDSSFICKDFPVSMFKSYVTKDPYDYVILRAAKQEMVGSIHPFYGAYKEDYSYYFFPKSSSLHFTTKFEGNDYDVDINYDTGITKQDYLGNTEIFYPIALKNTLSDILTANILIKSIKINNEEFPVNEVMTLQGFPKNRYQIEESNK